MMDAAQHDSSASWRGRVSLTDADALPGRYYVTARDAGKTAFLLGPYTQPTLGKNGHARALGRVRAARRYVNDHYPWSHFWHFGTARLPLIGDAPVGKLNDLVGL